jgi:hypothetical protein
MAEGGEMGAAVDGERGVGDEMGTGAANRRRCVRTLAHSMLSSAAWQQQREKW